MSDWSVKRCTVKEKGANGRDYDSIQENAGTVTALKSPAGFVDHYSEEASYVALPSIIITTRMQVQ